MSTTIILGTQWGDEGKGKIVDVFAQEADWVVRAQGGHNAGHTLVTKDKEYKLHLIPSGILSPKAKCLIGAGVVLDPKILCQEIEMLKNNGIEVVKRLKVLESAHLIFPYHQMLDKLNEQSRRKDPIGTTLSGIGPAYADKVNRIGIRLGDLEDPNLFKEKLSVVVKHYNRLFTQLYNEEQIDLNLLFDQYRKYWEILKSFVCSTEDNPIYKAIRENKKILFEGAQGTFLDTSFGTYPYVTSSSTLASGICMGAGVGPRDISSVMGVVKAYTTRVGEGPMPTAFERVEGFPMQTEARELGVTTGRVRRMGWIDLPLIKHAVELNSIDQIALTKLDILDQVKTIRLCVGYKVGSKTLKKLPLQTNLLQQIEPIYEEMTGWMEKTDSMTSYSQLPAKAKEYIERIESYCECSISYVSVGPKRSQLIKRPL